MNNNLLFFIIIFFSSVVFAASNEEGAILEALEQYPDAHIISINEHDRYFRIKLDDVGYVRIIQITKSSGDDD